MHRRIAGNGKLVGVCAVVALLLALMAALRFADSAPAADAQTAQTQTTQTSDPGPLLGVNVAGAHINLGMLAPANATVTFYEVVDGARQELGTASSRPPDPNATLGLASIPAVPWTCDRAIRNFEAEARTTKGQVVEAANTARTPDCRNRIAVTAPGRVNPGSTVKIVLRDRWQLGDVRMRLCTTFAPASATKSSKAAAKKAHAAAARTCSLVKIAPGLKATAVKRPAGTTVGVLSVDLKIAGFHVQRAVGIGEAAPAGVNTAKPIALVTGDSMMEGIDTILQQKLKNTYRVIGQVRPGTGVSKNLGQSWTSLAKDQASKLHPTVTIVLLGGNDGYPMTTPAGGDQVPCCGEPWRVEYLRRLEIMADAYLRNGKGSLIWSLLPPPKRSDLVEQMSAVNDVIRRLAAAHPEIQLVPLDKIFGPEYHDTINGQHVRDPDGLHLSLPGQRIAANAIVQAVHAAVPEAR